jgi:predicted KAP-like P-loop ATPase
MWNDIETTQDFLNFSVVANTVAELIIESNGQPISIGVSGNWGAGKSSMVKMIGEALKKSDEGNDEKKKNYVFLEFNAWLYQGYDDARAALMQAVSDKLNEEVNIRKPTKTVIDKVTDFTKRINWLQLAKLIIPLTVSLIPGAAPVGGIASLLGMLKNKNQDTTASENVNSSPNAAIESVFSNFEGLIKENSTKSMPRQIEELRSGFAEILKDLNITLVVLVDDLDRCLPTTAISTLEAMRLLLFVPRTAFIIAADEQMIRNGVKAHFKNVELTDGLVTSYFDKLIQIPLTVPHLGVAEIKIYLVLLFAELAARRNLINDDALTKIKEELTSLLRSAWQGSIPKNKIEKAFEGKSIDSKALPEIHNSIEIAEQLAGILVSAENINGNPRLIKRFLNALKIREKVAKLNGITVDFSCLVKMLLFERCASAGAFEFLLKKSAESQDGKLEFLQVIEKALADGKEYVHPDLTWKSPFFESWLKLAPPLGDVDIRPLMYLSRDKSLSIAAYDELSPEAREILAALTQVDNPTLILELIEKIKLIGETESEMLLNRIARIGRTNQWDVNTLCAALHISQVYPNLGKNIVGFLSEIPAISRKPSYIPVLKDKTWASEMLNQWSMDSNTPKPVKNAIDGGKK